MSCSISYRVSNFVDKTSILMLWWCVVLLRAHISGFIIDLAKYKLEQWLGRYCEPSTHSITLNGRIIRLSTHCVLLFDSTKTDPHTHTHVHWMTRIKILTCVTSPVLHIFRSLNWNEHIHHAYNYTFTHPCSFLFYSLLCTVIVVQMWSAYVCNGVVQEIPNYLYISSCVHIVVTLNEHVK